MEKHHQPCRETTIHPGRLRFCVPIDAEGANKCPSAFSSNLLGVTTMLRDIVHQITFIVIFSGLLILILGALT